MKVLISIALVFVAVGAFVALCVAYVAAAIEIVVRLFLGWL